jgi:pimeloyl-ACP methyl ester carboxylesterase
MPSFRSDDVDIAYEIYGNGDPVLLIHGFASNSRVNWSETNWIDTLTGDGRMAIAMDNRGHGESGKLYDPAAYGAPTMAEDARRLLEHLSIPRADILGYSMGSRIAAFLAMNHPERVRSAIFSGLAANMIHGVGGAEPIAQALEARDASEIKDIMPLAFRMFAESTGSDLKALAACMRSSRQKISEAELGEISVPVLVAVGSLDDVAGPLEPLVDAIPGAKGLLIPDRDHMRSVGDKVFKQGVLEFLANRP